MESWHKNWFLNAGKERVNSNAGMILETSSQLQYKAFRFCIIDPEVLRPWVWRKHWNPWKAYKNFAVSDLQLHISKAQGRHDGKSQAVNYHMSNGLNLLHPRKDVAEMVSHRFLCVPYRSWRFGVRKVDHVSLCIINEDAHSVTRTLFPVHQLLQVVLSFRMRLHPFKKLNR